MCKTRIFLLEEYFENIYISYGFFLIGFLLTQIVTLIGKKTIGRLRPNFLDVCIPEINPYGVCGELHQTGKIAKFTNIFIESYRLFYIIR